MGIGSNIPRTHVQQFVDGEVRQINLAEFSAGKKRFSLSQFRVLSRRPVQMITSQVISQTLPHSGTKVWKRLLSLPRTISLW